MRLASVAVFLLAIAGYYHEGVGFTSLIEFADSPETEIPLVRDTPHYRHANPAGADGQYYAQMAVDPLLRHPAIDHALDHPPYRARRILFSWTAFALGLGRPFWVLQAYAVQNVICWLGLAWWLSRRVDAGVRGFLVWFACLFTHGLLISVRQSLLDGPSMFVIALGVTALERERYRLGSAVLGVAGLGRETNLLAGAALLRTTPWNQRTIVRSIGCLALMAAPLLLWLDYLRSVYRSTTFDGHDQVSTPIASFVEVWRVTPPLHWWAVWPPPELLALVALTVQGAFVCAKIRSRNPWALVGAAYAALMLTLHFGVWEGSPGAATRVLLPMTFAFNLLLPQGRWFWPLWAAGNLTILPGLSAIDWPLARP